MSNSIVYPTNGLPLWKPDPNATLSEVYIKNGISTGDLGIRTDDGGFDYLFNIHADADDPINNPLPLDTTKDITVTTFQHPEGAYITRNASFEVRSNIAAGGMAVAYAVGCFNHFFTWLIPATDISLAIEFSIIEECDAMLVLPHGADRYEAKAYGKYKAYVFSHSESWYEHLNQVQQREARNGSLYLVTGCNKAHSWGLAAGSLHQERTMGFSITARSQASGTVGTIYASWPNTGGMESRHFLPSTTEITKNTNQCVFARGFVIGINEKFLQKEVRGTIQDTMNIDNAKTIADVIVWDAFDYPKPVSVFPKQSNIDVIIVHDNNWITATASNAENIFTLDGTDYEHLTARVLEICHPTISASAAPSQQDRILAKCVDHRPLRGLMDVRVGSSRKDRENKEERERENKEKEEKEKEKERKAAESAAKAKDKERR
ncbi:hypothetical protein CVT25_001307 [Psilocybe cyanescens]|uniref:Uncharacterized protein n=1 Tax=Psilocybe cyanescens TaxID=93625 RepID=A0A409XEL7_PSICY|nr:hypothetical protein CVT25_001307 [Psilocybe cyanescens]